MRRDSVLFRYVVDVLILVSALVMLSLSRGGRVVELLLPDDPGASRPPVTAPDPERRRLLERLPIYRPRPRDC